MTYLIDVIEYRLPDGRRINHTLEVSEDIYKIWKRLKAHNFNITVERLTTGEVSTAIEGQNIDVDIDITPERATQEDREKSLYTMLRKVTDEVLAEYIKADKEAS